MMTPYEDAARAVLQEFSWNRWFVESYWPEHEPRAREMARLAGGLLRGGGAPAGLDAGCGNGYITRIFSLMGFEMSAIDAYDDQTRAEMFARARIAYRTANLNEAVPLRELSDASFDLVIAGEVFEHVLNDPAGLLRAVYRVLRPGGLLVLTTPNPSTLANAVRVAGDRSTLWGTEAFLREPKISAAGVISRADIHYREYPAWMVRDLLSEIGYRVECVGYWSTGTTPRQSLPKRLAKRALEWCGLARHRLFAFGYVAAARKA